MSIKCPHCRANVVQKSLDGRVRIRTQGVIVFGPDGAQAICKACRKPVELDLVMGTSMRKSLDRDPPLVLRNVDSAETGT